MSVGKKMIAKNFDDENTAGQNETTTKLTDDV